MSVTCDRVVSGSSAKATLLKFGNGITLVHQEIPTSAVASVDIWVKAGAASDPDRALGMAHFLEHMIFKGTDQIAPGEFDFAIESEGGISNAATSYDYAHYTFTVEASRFEVTLPKLLKMLLDAKIDEQELEQERSVVLEELRQAIDNPDWLAYQHLLETAYGKHAYGRSVLGSESVITQITAAQMREYHRSHYLPERMTVAIAGAVTREAAIASLNACFDNNFAYNNFSNNIPALDSSLIANNLEPISPPRRATINLPRTKYSRLNIAWIGASAASLDEAIQLELLSAILTEGRSSRLVRELLEGLGWVHDITSSFSVQLQSGLFTITACLDTDFLELVEREIIQQVNDLLINPIAEAELNKAKRSLCNHFTFALESPSQLASFLGYHSLLGCESLCNDWSNAYCEIIRKLQPSDLQYLAQKYLSPENYVVTYAIPE